MQYNSAAKSLDRRIMNPFHGYKKKKQLSHFFLRVNPPVQQGKGI